MSGVADAEARTSPLATTRRFDSALVLLALVLLWTLGSAAAGSEALPSPWATLARLGRLLGEPGFGADLWETTRAFAFALAISVVGGIVFGAALGSHRLSGDVAEPVLVTFYSIPKVTLYPVILLLFGLGVSAKVAFGVIHGIIPITLFTMGAVRSIRAVIIRTVSAMRLTRRQALTHVLIPAALPEIVSGIRLGFALTLLGTLIGEMFASQRGLGSQLMKAMESGDNDTVLAVATILIVVATLASAEFLAIERRFGPAR